MSKFKCDVCGYVYEGKNPPEICPKCKRPVSWTMIADVETPTPPPGLKGSKTEKNLQEAFAGESMATNKYHFFASRAKKDGYVQISRIFEETSCNERAHAKIWYKYLNGGDISDTPTNLKEAADGEHFEHTVMYAEMAKTAREEGFNEIAIKMELVAAIEKTHEDRYRKLLQNIEEGIVFVRPDDRIWVCLECGHITIGKAAPDVCPVCSHPQAYQELKPENY